MYYVKEIGIVGKAQETSWDAAMHDTGCLCLGAVYMQCVTVCSVAV